VWEETDVSSAIDGDDDEGRPLDWDLWRLGGTQTYYCTAATIYRDGSVDVALYGPLDPARTVDGRKVRPGWHLQPMTQDTHDMDWFEDALRSGRLVHRSLVDATPADRRERRRIDREIRAQRTLCATSGHDWAGDICKNCYARWDQTPEQDR
jgi:hypothetical protein